VSQIKANRKILKVTKFGLRKLKPFFNIKQFIGPGVNLTPASRRRVNVIQLTEPNQICNIHCTFYLPNKLSIFQTS